jgi:hypothetical protein
MLLMIGQPQVVVAASHRPPKTRANAGDWGS